MLTAIRTRALARCDNKWRLSLSFSLQRCRLAAIYAHAARPRSTPLKWCIHGRSQRLNMRANYLSTTGDWARTQGACPDFSHVPEGYLSDTLHLQSYHKVHALRAHVLTTGR